MESVRDFLASLSFLNEAQILELVASWEARDVRAHEDAWTQAIACAVANRLTAEMDEARPAAMTWAIRGKNAPWHDGGRMEDTCRDIRRGAGPALEDAAVAIVLGNRLDEATRALLMEPWLQAVEGMPEAEA